MTWIWVLNGWTQRGFKLNKSNTLIIWFFILYSVCAYKGSEYWPMSIYIAYIVLDFELPDT